MQSWALSVLPSTKGQESISVRTKDGLARARGSRSGLALEVTGIDEIQRRTYLAKPALSHMQVN